MYLLSLYCGIYWFFIREWLLWEIEYDENHKGLCVIKKRTIFFIISGIFLSNSFLVYSWDASYVGSAMQNPHVQEVIMRSAWSGLSSSSLVGISLTTKIAVAAAVFSVGGLAWRYGWILKIFKGFWDLKHVAGDVKDVKQKLNTVEQTINGHTDALHQIQRNQATQGQQLTDLQGQVASVDQKVDEVKITGEQTFALVDKVKKDVVQVSNQVRTLFEQGEFNSKQLTDIEKKLETIEQASANNTEILEGVKNIQEQLQDHRDHHYEVPNKIDENTEVLVATHENTTTLVSRLESVIQNRVPQVVQTAMAQVMGINGSVSFEPQSGAQPSSWMNAMTTSFAQKINPELKSTQERVQSAMQQTDQVQKTLKDLTQKVDNLANAPETKEVPQEHSAVVEALTRQMQELTFRVQELLKAQEAQPQAQPLINQLAELKVMMQAIVKTQEEFTRQQEQKKCEEQPHAQKEVGPQSIVCGENGYKMDVLKEIHESKEANQALLVELTKLRLAKQEKKEKKKAQKQQKKKANGYNSFRLPYEVKRKDDVTQEQRKWIAIGALLMMQSQKQVPFKVPPTELGYDTASGTTNGVFRHHHKGLVASLIGVDVFQSPISSKKNGSVSASKLNLDNLLILDNNDNEDWFKQ